MMLLAFPMATAMAHAQTPGEKFVQYGLCVDRARTAAAHGAHQEAIAIYDSAFALVPFMAYDQFLAAVNAVQAGDDARANDLLISATENGLTVDGLYDPDLQIFLLSERCMPYLNMRDYMTARWLAHADTAMIRQLADIPFDVIREDSMGGVQRSIDPAAFDALLALARQSGWPTPITVGSHFLRAQRILFELLDHYPDSPEWQQALPYIRSAMARGALPPDYLTIFQDLADLDQGKPMTYGVMLAYFRETPDKWYVVDRARLEKNRRAVGLGPLEDELFRDHLDPKLVRYAE